VAGDRDYAGLVATGPQRKVGRVKYELVMKITDETGKLTETSWMEPVASFGPVWWCSECEEVQEITDAEDIQSLLRCPACQAQVEWVALVECPHCEATVPVYDILDHWGEGCTTW